MTLEAWLIVGSVIVVLVVAGCVIASLSFVWWQRSQWENERTMLEAQHEREKTDADEAHKVQLRELDRFNAEERRRLEERIDELQEEVKLLRAQRASDWEMLRQVLAGRGIDVPKSPPAMAITVQGDATFRDAVGRDKTESR